MKKIISVIVSAVLLMCCAGCRDLDVAEESSQIKGAPLSGTLTISSFFWGDYYQYMADKFTEKYPDVKIEVRDSLEYTVGMDWSSKLYEISQKQIVDLLSGEGADIYTSDTLSPYKLSKSGVFEDLYEYMDSDAEFNLEDYYTNIFESFKNSGKLYAMPAAFSWNMLRMNKTVADELGFVVPDSMNYSEIQAVFNEAAEKGILDSDAVLEGRNSVRPCFDQAEYRCYIDTDNLSSDFDSDGFVKYLRALKDINFRDSSEDRLIYNDDDYDFSDRKALIYSLDMDLFHCKSLSQATDTATEAFALASSDGKIPFLNKGTSYSINSGSKNKELAWEYLKFLISEHDYDFENENSPDYYEKYPIFFAMPVNKANFGKLANYFLDGDETAAKVLEDEILRLNTIAFYDIHLNKAFDEIFSDYFDKNLITAEECAKRMQERTKIFLGE